MIIERTKDENAGLSQEFSLGESINQKPRLIQSVKHSLVDLHDQNKDSIFLTMPDTQAPFDSISQNTIPMTEVDYKHYDELFKKIKASTEKE